MYTKKPVGLREKRASREGDKSLHLHAYKLHVKEVQYKNTKNGDVSVDSC